MTDVRSSTNDKSTAVKTTRIIRALTGPSENDGGTIIDLKGGGTED